MTEIPMPSDYSPQQQPKESKGCCTQCCECWLYLLVIGVIFIIIVLLLFLGSFSMWFDFLP